MIRGEEVIDARRSIPGAHCATVGCPFSSATPLLVGTLARVAACGVEVRQLAERWSWALFRSLFQSRGASREPHRQSNNSPSINSTLVQSASRVKVPAIEQQ